ncbi:hypothetical protein D3C72_2080170 [compost metagenome]
MDIFQPSQGVMNDLETIEIMLQVMLAIFMRVDPGRQGKPGFFQPFHGIGIPGALPFEIVENPDGLPLDIPA